MYHYPVSTTSNRKCNGCRTKRQTKTFEMTMSPYQYSRQRNPLVTSLSRDSGGAKISRIFRAQLCNSCSGISSKFSESRHITRTSEPYQKRPWAKNRSGR